MSWTDLPADETTHWQCVEFVNQFRQALRERTLLVRDTLYSSSIPFPDLEAGDDIQSAQTLWHAMQDRCVYLATHLYIPVEPSALAGLDHIPVFTSNAFFAAAGLNPAGWTRKRPREIKRLADAGEDGQIARAIHVYQIPNPDVEPRRIYVHQGGAWTLADDQTLSPDVVTSFGPMDRGDYIGPWVFNELQKAIQTLRAGIKYATGASPQASATPGYTSPRQKAVYGPSADTFEEASSEAISQWNDANSQNDYNYTGEIGVFSRTLAQLDGDGHASYSVTLFSEQYQLSVGYNAEGGVGDIAFPINATVYFFGSAKAPDDLGYSQSPVFNANGTNLEDQAITLLEVKTISDDWVTVNETASNVGYFALGPVVGDADAAPAIASPDLPAASSQSNETAKGLVVKNLYSPDQIPNLTDQASFFAVVEGAFEYP